MVDNKKIIKLREEKGITQEQLAEAVHVTRQMITGMEVGVKQPSIDLLQRMAVYFNCSLDDLVIPPQREETA